VLSKNAFRLLNTNLHDLVSLLRLTIPAKAVRLYVKSIPPTGEIFDFQIGVWKHDLEVSIDQVTCSDFLSFPQLKSNVEIEELSGIEFYMREPLSTQDSFAIGTISIANDEPIVVSENQSQALGLIVHQIVRNFEEYERSITISELNRETQNARKNLKAISNRLVAIMDNLDSGLIVEDPQNNIIHINNGFCSMFDLNRSPAELIDSDGSLVQDKISKIFSQEQEFLQMKNEKLQDKKKSLRQEFKLNDGRIIEQDYIPIYNRNEYAGHIWHYRDITFLKSVQSQALEAAQLKSEFLANMSHEIRTPLNGIIGMVDILKTTPLSDQQSEFVHTVKSSATTLLELINDILDFSKIEAGKVEIEKISFSLVSILKELAMVMKPVADKKGLELSVYMDEDIKDGFLGDPVRIKQILYNLMGNAIKFTHKGNIEIRVEKIKQRSSDVTLRLSIVDSGIGMSETAVAKLFQPFTQADASTTRKYGGTGLGLSISKGLVDLMKGKIGVKSTEGKGSTFWFEIPLLTTTVVPAQQGSTADHSFEMPSWKVLVAEDNQINQMVIREMLTRLGQEVTIASNGVEAVEKAQSENFDLIFMDVMMPEMDGLEATRTLRKLESMKDIHIVALTANSMKGDREKCLDAGMNEYLSKPIQMQALKSMLLKVMGVDANTEESTPTAEALALSAKALSSADKLTLPENLSKKQTESSQTSEKTATKNEFLSKKALFELEKMGFELLISVVESFKEESPGILTELNQVIQDKNYQQIYALSHKLKSTAKLVGAMDLADICLQMETEARLRKEQSPLDFKESLEKTKTLFQQSVQALEQYIQSHKPAA
jgi:signal transduction histidine kinase/CheY-like chemotaxis protein